MISIYKEGQAFDTPAMEYRGLSTDTKPSGAPNGSMFMEINTGKVFMYDAENDYWYQIGG